MEHGAGSADFTGMNSARTIHFVYTDELSASLNREPPEYSGRLVSPVYGRIIWLLIPGCGLILCVGVGFDSQA